MGDKLILDRELYKRIKRMDRQTMQALLQEFYNMGAESIESVNIDKNALRSDIGQFKGIGANRLEEIMSII